MLFLVAERFLGVTLLQIKHLRKKFEIADAKLLVKLQAEGQVQDSRIQGRFFHSLQDVSFSCEQGQVLGLLGPNGAGKTTTLRILSTALTADAGEIWLNQQNLTHSPEDLRCKIGFLSGSTGLYGRLTGRENITYFGQLHGVATAEIRERIKSLAARLDMTSFLDRRCETYSTGMKQKTAIARAVIHQPEVVIFDEPTTGLDIMAAQTVLNFIQELKQQGTPVIFSTHHLDEVAALCDRVCVVSEGRSVFDASFTQFEQLASECVDTSTSLGASLHGAFLQALTANPPVSSAQIQTTNQEESA